MKNRIVKRVKSQKRRELVKTERTGDIEVKHYASGGMVLTVYGKTNRKLQQIADRLGITFRKLVMDALWEGVQKTKSKTGEVAGAQRQ